MSAFDLELAALTPVVRQVPDWFPPSSRVMPSLADAQRYCRRLATGHYENFPLVSLLLPRNLHQHFFNVYAFCRWADDLGDETGDPARSLELLGWWRKELEDCYAGECRHPVFVALKPTMDEFNLPINLFADLISAFEQDQTLREYQTEEQLLDYCTRSANPVGRIVLQLCRQATPRNCEWSDAICTGLQLANFWQDVARDLDIGRIYLPAEHRDSFQVSRDDLLARRTTSGFIELMTFEVARSRDLFHRGLPLIEHLPGRLQIDIDLFARGGLCILDRIERIGYRVLERRPVVTKRDAFVLLMKSIGSALVRRFRF